MPWNQAIPRARLRTSGSRVFAPAERTFVAMAGIVRWRTRNARKWDANPSVAAHVRPATRRAAGHDHYDAVTAAQVPRMSLLQDPRPLAARAPLDAAA
jgi:hypothetical protein